MDQDVFLLRVVEHLDALEDVLHAVVLQYLVHFAPLSALQRVVVDRVDVHAFRDVVAFLGNFFASLV